VVIKQWHFKILKYFEAFFFKDLQVENILLSRCSKSLMGYLHEYLIEQHYTRII